MPDIVVQGRLSQCEKGLVSLRILFFFCPVVIKGQSGSVRDTVFVFIFNKSISCYAEKLARKLVIFCSIIEWWFPFFVMKFNHTFLLKLAKVCLTMVAFW